MNRRLTSIVACLRLAVASACVAWGALPAAGESGLATLTVEADLCADVGSEIVVTIRFSDSLSRVVAAQYVLEYNPQNMTVIPPVPAGDAPFVLPFIRDISVLGRIAYAVGIFPFTDPGRFEGVLGRITFQITTDVGERYVRFERASDPPTQLSGRSGSPIIPLLVGAESVDVDLVDFADFQVCFSGPETEASALCRCSFDLDSDGDVDLDDFDPLQAQLAGPELPDCP